MRIGYQLDEDTRTTYAYTTYGEFEDLEGTDFGVAYGLMDRGYLKQSDVCERKFVSKARNGGSDEFDAETGRQVARDKLLVKYYGYVGDKLDAYIAALEKELARAKGTQEFAKSKVENATRRLEVVNERGRQ